MKEPEEDQKTIIRRAALRFLARRDYSEDELSQKLAHKGYEPDAIQSVLATLTQKQLLSNTRFTEQFVHYQKRKGFGPVRISLALKARGISEEMIAEHVQITDNSWQAAAEALWRKHFKGKLPENRNEKAKQMRFLQYRGFTIEQICKLFN